MVCALREYMDRQSIGNGYAWPACVGVEEVAAIFGWPEYFLPVLVRTGHLKPLGRPAQNSRKWFARVELEHLARDREWLDKAIRIVEKHVQQVNEKQRSKVSELSTEDAAAAA
jgi:hypothetical protein